MMGIIKHWKRALGLIGIYISLMFIIGMSEFMYEEAAQASTPYICKDAIKFSNSEEEITNSLKVCMAAYNTQEVIVNQGEYFTNAFGWISPMNYWAYKAVWIAYRSSLKINRELLPLVAANTQSYLVEQVIPEKYCHNDYSYEYATIQLNENDVKGIRDVTSQYSNSGWHIIESYTTKDKNQWWLVMLFEKVVVTEVCK